MSNLKVINQKISVTLQTGFHCSNCDFENVVKGHFDQKPPCANCGEDKLIQKWQSNIKTVTSIESV